MKIGLNTYSFRKELKSGEYTLDIIWQILDKIGLIEGIELFDGHIPGWPDGDLDRGIKQVLEQIEPHGWKLFSLGPHFKLYQRSQKLIEKESIEIKRWIELAANNDIPDIRAQVAGPFNFKKNLPKHVQRVIDLLDKVISYAEEMNVKIVIETHHQLSSYPPFLKVITEHYKKSPALGINYDWGNFPNNEARYETLKIATRPYNHAHNHVKIFNFGENFQETKYDTIKIIDSYRKAGFKDYFSIEFEGTQNSIEGVYKSAHALKHAITGGKHKIDTNFNWKSLKP